MSEGPPAQVLPIASVRPRSRARVVGEVRVVDPGPADADPVLRVTIADDTAEIDLVFHGRRDVPGIEPGRRLSAEGMVQVGDRPVLLDPEYVLLPTADQALQAQAAGAPLLDRRRGLGQVTAEDFSLAESLGGVRGVVEAVAPGAVFVVAFVLTRELTIPLVSSLVVAVVLCVVRLLQRTPLTQALSGLLGVGIGVVWAWRSGEAQDFFAWGLYVNAAYALGILVAILLRWPPIGVLVELLRGRSMAWRTDPTAAVLRRRYVVASWLWVGVFLVRLAVQVPLYLAGEVAALGVARLVMGIPLFALAAWITWMLVREPGPVTAGPAEPAAR